FERTQCDLVAEADQTDGNDTVFDASEGTDDGDETDGTDGETLSPDNTLQAEIRAAQSELLNRLDAAGALDGGETVDSTESSEEYVSPYVFDPSEGSITSESELPSSSQRLKVSEPNAMDDKTSVSPLLTEDPTPSEG